jgi:hypothetical protein
MAGGLPSERVSTPAPAHDEAACERRWEESNMLRMSTHQLATAAADVEDLRSPRRQRAHYAARICRDANRAGLESTRVEPNAEQCHAPTGIGVDAAVIHHRMAASHVYQCRVLDQDVVVVVVLWRPSNSRRVHARRRNISSSSSGCPRRCMVAAAAVQSGVDDRPARLRLY